MDQEDTIEVLLKIVVDDFLSGMKLAQSQFDTLAQHGREAFKTMWDSGEGMDAIQRTQDGLKLEVEAVKAAEKEKLKATREAAQQWIAENSQKSKLLAELQKQELADKKAAEKEKLNAEKETERIRRDNIQQTLRMEKELEKEIVAENKKKADEIKKQEEDLAKFRANTMKGIGDTLKNSFSLVGNFAVGSVNIVKGVLSGLLQFGSGVVNAIGSVINSLKNGLNAIAQGMGVIAAPLAAIIGLGVKAASENEEAWNRLLSRQQAELAINSSLQDRQAGYYNVLNATSKEVDKLRKELISKNNSLERAQFIYDHSAKKTDAMRVSLEYWRKEVNETNAAIVKASGSHQVWLGFKEADGKVTQMSRQALNDLAIEFEKTTRFTRENVIETAGFASMYTNIGASIMPRAIESALNLSTVMGTDLKTAMVDIGEALQDPIKGWSRLRSVGVQFTDDERNKMEVLVKSGKLLEAQEIILKRLSYQLEGAAVAAGSTFAGALDILRNALRRLIEPIGEVVLPKLHDLVDMFINFTNYVTVIPKEIVDQAMAFVGLASAVGLAATAISLLLSPIGLVIGAIAGIKIAIDNNLGGLGDTFRGIYNTVKPEIDNITNAIQSIMKAFSFKPEDNVEWMNKMGKAPANPSIATRRFEQQDNDQKGYATVADVPGLLKQKAQQEYAANLKSTIEQAGKEIVNSLVSMITKIGNWALGEGQRLFKEAFKNIFGIDFSTALENVKNAFGEGTPGRKILDTLMNDLKVIVDNLKGADWSGFAQGIGKAGAILAILAALGVGEFMKIFSKTIRDLVDAVAAANMGDFSTLAWSLLEIATAFVFISNAGNIAGALWAIAAPIVAIASPVLVVAGAFLLLVGALKWIDDNTKIISDGIDGWKEAFKNIGIAIRYWFIGALIGALDILITFVKLLAIVAGAFGKITNDWGPANSLAKAALDLDDLKADMQGAQNGGSGDYQTKNKKQSSNYGLPFHPAGGGSNSVQQPVINVNHVIVQKPNDYNQIYEQVIKEAKRQTTPIIEPKLRKTYA